MSLAAFSATAVYQPECARPREATHEARTAAPARSATTMNHSGRISASRTTAIAPVVASHPPMGQASASANVFNQTITIRPV